MKKYMKSIRTLAVLLMAGAAFVSCSKDEEPEHAASQTFTLTVNASKGGDNATKQLVLDGHTLNATWAEGEAVTVYNITKSADLTGSLVAQSSGVSTTLKGTLSGTIANGDKLLLKFLSPTYSGQNGTLEYIAAHCDYAEATVTVTDASTLSVTTTDAEFVNKQAVVKFTLNNKATDAAISATQLIVSDGTNSYTITPASASSEIYVAIPGFSSKTITLDASIAGKLFTYSRNPVTFTDGQYYEITVKMSAVPGSLAGKFTINESGDQVRFSQGNLRATSSNMGRLWSFAENQYECLDCSSNYIINGSIDLFGWNGETSGADNYGISDSGDDSDYGNTAGENLKHDWGHNPITNGGNTADIWRTLTKAEWEYLFNTRSTPSGIRFASATVNGKDGMLLLPDDWSTSYYSFSSTNTVDEPILNSISADDWIQLEAHGAVFLPATKDLHSGKYMARNPSISEVYWTSTSHETTASNAYVMFIMHSLGDSPSARSFNRHFGCHVRLVRNVN